MNNEKTIILQQDRSKNTLLMAFVVLFIIPISGVAIDIYTPSLPAISAHFHIGHTLTQWSITAYLIGLGIFQLLAGPISDTLGRRLPILIALSIFTLSSLMMVTTHSIYTILFLRCLQGAAVAISIVPLRAVISDLFTGHEYYKMMSYMTIMWALGPIVAPALGGYLQHHFNWQANFIFLTIYGGISLTLFYFSVEETSIHRHDFSLSSILLRSKTILRSTQFLKNIIINGMIYSLIIIFSTMAPFILQNTLNYSAQAYGSTALLAGLAWLTGTLINRVTLCVPMEKKAKWCLSTMLMLSFVLLFVTYFFKLTALSLLIPTLLMLLVGGIIFPNIFARSLALFPTLSGSAGALYGCAISSFAGIASSISSLASTQSGLSFAFMMLSTTVISFLVFYLFKD